LGRVRGLLAGAPDATVLVLPELWATGYFSFDRYAAEAAPLAEGPAAEIAPIAAERCTTIVAGSVVEHAGGRRYNTIPVLGPDGSLLASYRKMHLFGYGSAERDLLTPGDRAVVAETPAGRLGIATCFDLRFPEQFAAMRDAGADLIVVPAAWPAARAEHWRILARARAIETQTPLAGCNGAGVNEGTALAGASLVCDARGEVLADGGDGEGWIVATVDSGDTRRWREEFPLS
ncbi:MAG: nitrilase-related carbon-nitrogen hydrolase, partial [Vicinamibacteria bacterium]